MEPFDDLSESLFARSDLAWVATYIGTFPAHLVVLTEEFDKAKGFQFESQPKPNQGLFFVYDEIGTKVFHMRNVAFDLVLICLDSSNNVIGAIPMKANSNQTYSTPNDTQSVIEMTAKWDGFDLVSEGDNFHIIGAI